MGSLDSAVSGVLSLSPSTTLLSSHEIYRPFRTANPATRPSSRLLTPSAPLTPLQLPFKFADPESKALAMQAIMHSSASHETNNVALARVGEFVSARWREERGATR